MAIKEKYESNASESVGENPSSKLESNDISENISNLLDNYDIEVLDAHLEQCIKKNSKLKKKNKKLMNDFELMTQCFVEMVEKNDRLEEELKNLKKEALLLASTQR